MRAALKHVPMVELNPCEGVLTNVIGTMNVARATQACNARAMVQISTDKVVNTTNIMGATKRLAELYCQALDLASASRQERTRFMTVRFGNVLGSSGSLIPLFERQLAARRPADRHRPGHETLFHDDQGGGGADTAGNRPTGSKANPRSARSSYWTWASRSGSSTWRNG